MRRHYGVDQSVNTLCLAKTSLSSIDLYKCAFVIAAPYDECAHIMSCQYGLAKSALGGYDSLLCQ